MESRIKYQGLDSGEQNYWQEKYFFFAPKKPNHSFFTFDAKKNMLCLFKKKIAFLE